MEGYTKDEFQLATEILQKFVPNKYPPYNNWVKAMMEYGRLYHEQQVKSVDLDDVGGALRELADKYEKDALERYENGDHALSYLHMAAQARYGFEDGWNAAKKQ